MQPQNMSSQEKLDMKSAGYAWWPIDASNTEGRWWAPQEEDPQKWYCWGSKEHIRIQEKYKKDREEKLATAATEARQRQQGPQGFSTGPQGPEAGGAGTTGEAGGDGATGPLGEVLT
jgi:hypothetical protein